MDFVKKFYVKLTNNESLLPPLTKNMSIVTIDNENKIYIENGCHILNFSSSEIRLRTSIGDIHIYGSELFIKSMYAQQLILEGNISTMSYHRFERM